MATPDLPLRLTPKALAERLGRPDLRIVDASWYLPDAGRDPAAEHARAHLPGAVHLDLSRDLADPDAPVRNTLALPEALARRFASSGIGTGHQVVIYDHLGGYSAGRVWWALRVAGHEHAALLDGGLEAWRADGLPLSAEPVRPAVAAFEARPRPELLADRARVLEIVRSGGAVVVDARSPARFRGEAPEHVRRAGRIPGSVNVPWDRNLAGEPPRFRPVDEIRALYEATGVRFDRPVVTTCGSGVTASLDAFALVLAGHPDVAVYDGSWAEWGDDPDLPIETGAPAA